MGDGPESRVTQFAPDPHKFDPLLVEDPLCPTNNVGRNCFRIYYMQRACADAHSILCRALKEGGPSKYLLPLILKDAGASPLLRESARQVNLGDLEGHGDLLSDAASFSQSYSGGADEPLHIDTAKSINDDAASRGRGTGELLHEAVNAKKISRSSSAEKLAW